MLVWRAPHPSEDFKVFASKVGENGIEADTWYELSADGMPVAAEVSQ